VGELVNIIQIDVMDGKFVPSASWPYNNQDIDEDGKVVAKDSDWKNLIDQTVGIPFWKECSFEVDLMVADQLGEAKNWISAGVDRVIFHLEALIDQETEVGSEEVWKEIIDIKEQGIDLSFAIVPETPNSKLEKYLEVAESVQFMGINKIGYQGQDFEPKVLEKIAELREKNPDLAISVDGGVSFKTARDLVDAGANRLASGSTIFKAENAKRAIENLRKMANSLV